MKEINIYGDIVPFKWMNDGSEFDLKDINTLLSNLDINEGDELVVNIHTFGGCTTTAFGIYNKLLRFKNEKNITLTTRVDGFCASSGVILLLAGDKRIGNQFAEPFIHNAWTVTMGDANEMKKQFEELEKVNSQIANLYAERTNISKEKAIELMNADDFVSAEDALAFGFFTELENSVQAQDLLIFNSIRERNQKIKNKMSEATKGKSFKQKLMDFLNGTQNKIVFTAENEELDFYQLDETATPIVGDVATFGGKPAGDVEGKENGYVIAETGETYVFEGETLKEIKPKEEEAVVDEEKESLIAENTQLNTDLATANQTIANLTSEKTAIQNKLNEATELIKTFNSITPEKPEEREKPAVNDNTDKSRVSTALRNLKNLK